jgi:hypothetical protein
VNAGYSQEKSQHLLKPREQAGVGLVPLLPINEKEARSFANLKKGMI